MGDLASTSASLSGVYCACCQSLYFAEEDTEVQGSAPPEWERAVRREGGHSASRNGGTQHGRVVSDICLVLPEQDGGRTDGPSRFPPIPAT